MYKVMNTGMIGGQLGGCPLQHISGFLWWSRLRRIQVRRGLASSGDDA